MHQRSIHITSVTAKIEKCQFGRKEIKYLSFNITQKYLPVDNSKTAVLQAMSSPKSLKEITNFSDMTHSTNGLYQIMLMSPSHYKNRKGNG